jgi:hypothetical protein
VSDGISSGPFLRVAEMMAEQSSGSSKVTRSCPRVKIFSRMDSRALLCPLVKRTSRIKSRSKTRSKLERIGKPRNFGGITKVSFDF